MSNLGRQRVLSYGEVMGRPSVLAATTGSPEEEAALLLARTWTDPRGQLALPIDPVYIAWRLDIEVYLSNLDPDVSAVIVANARERPAIYLNERDPLVRRCFSYAHELGHYVRRRASGATEFGFVDRRDHLTTTGTDPKERWANQFAAALLSRRTSSTALHNATRPQPRLRGCSTSPRPRWVAGSSTYNRRPVAL